MEHINVFEEELGIPYSVLRGCANGKANIWTLFAQQSEIRIGEECFEFSAKEEHFEKLFEFLFENEEMKLSGFKAWESLRLEVGYFDLLPEEVGKYTPEELGMGWLIQFALKGRDSSVSSFPSLLSLTFLSQTLKFLGYDALKKQVKPRTKRIGFEIGSKENIEKGAKISTGGKEVGWVTHVTYSPHLQKTIGAALVTDTSLSVYSLILFFRCLIAISHYKAGYRGIRR